MYTEMVGKRGYSLQRYVDLVSTNAAKIMGLYPRKGALAAGSDADICVLDPADKRVIRAADLHEADYTPWEGRKMEAWPCLTVLRGKVVVENGTCKGSLNDGKWQHRKSRGRDVHGADAVRPPADGAAWIELRALLIDCLTLWGIDGRVAVGADSMEISTGRDLPCAARRPDMRPVRWLLQTPNAAPPIARRAPRPRSSRLLTALRNALGADERAQQTPDRSTRTMKPDERNLPLSTDSPEAATLFDRAVEHYLKYHADTMTLVGRRSPPTQTSSWGTASRAT